eukprot:m.221152 g.221152  ORF g.221152 m.221152 type:complete len:395 (-) comp15608_c0_seq5:513-1697(-)
MPELPEVEATRRVVEQQLLGQRITAVCARECGGGSRDGLFDGLVIGEGVTEADFTAALLHTTVVGTGRKGKQMWIDVAPHTSGSSVSESRPVGQSLLVHLGMTGALQVRGVEGVRYARTKAPEAWPPRFTKLRLTFASGAELAFSDPRRLGLLLLRGDPIVEAPVCELAPDPTDPVHGVTLAHAVEVLKQTGGSIKAVLLDQRRLCCGVGNWVCDDVLLEARIHPAAVANTLTPAQVERLVGALHSVCGTACAADADTTRFPPHWLIHVRWKPGLRGQVTLDDGRIAKFSAVAGRTTVHIPALQPRGGDARPHPPQIKVHAATARARVRSAASVPKRTAANPPRAGKMTTRQVGTATGATSAFTHQRSRHRQLANEFAPRRTRRQLKYAAKTQD